MCADVHIVSGRSAESLKLYQGVDMHELEMAQEPQPDGTINHVSKDGCPLGVCVVMGIREGLPDPCPHLFVKLNSWHCDREPCLSGVD